MKALLDWTLESLRTDHAMMNWLEERRYEWAPLANNMLNQMMKGSSVIIITDPEFDWLSKYILKTINHPNVHRPLFPIFEAKTMFPFMDKMIAASNMEVMHDMLNISFKEGYTFWYIGRSNHISSTFAKEQRNSFLWVMDEEIQNSFFLRSADDLLDLKLLHMVRLFDKTLDAVFDGEIEL